MHCADTPQGSKGRNKRLQSAKGRLSSRAKKDDDDLKSKKASEAGDGRYSASCWADAVP